jgi:hypothetical protein
MIPLLDHFRPPLSLRRHWHAFPSAWSTYLASHLNEQLPEGYFAEPNVQFGIEIDVAAWQEPDAEAVPFGLTWTAPPSTQTIPLTVFTDLVEVLIYAREGGPTLAGAIELISPANKDRPAHREAFVSKCAAYLQQGVGLAVVDVVTDRRANLHAELLAHLQAIPASFPSDLYAAAYRPIEREGQATLDIWHEALLLGRNLPALPLWLRGNVCLRVDLGETYDRTCREQRILAEGA